MKIFIKKEVKEKFENELKKLAEEISQDNEFINIISDIFLSLEGTNEQ